MGALWNQMAVKTILVNPAYRGALAWNRRSFGKIHSVAADGTPIPKKASGTTRNPKDRWVVVEGVHEPLVSPALFQKAQDAMAKRRDKGGLARPSRRYLLSGLLRCTHCGLNYWGCVTKAHGVDHRYYADAGFRGQGKAVCKATHIQAEPLDRWVLEQLRDAFLGQQDAVESAVEQFVASVCGGAKPSKAPPDRSKELASITARIKSTVALLSDGDLADVEELKAALVNLKKQRQAIEADLAAPPTAAAPDAPDPAQLRSWARQRLEGLAAGLEPGTAPMELRAAVHEFVDRIEVDPHRKIGTLYLPEDAFSALQTSFCRRVRHGSSSHS